MVGLGSAGQGHIAAIRDNHEMALVGVVDEDPAKTSNASIPVCSYDDVLRNEAIDVVALCVPPGGRARLVAQAVEANKHVMVEKPPATCVRELEDLVTKAAAADARAAVMFQHRLCLPERLLAAEPRELAQRFAGSTASLVVSRPRHESHYTSGWRARPTSSSGGVTAHLGVHYLDLASQILGPVDSATVVSRVEAAPGVDTQLTGWVRFSSGAMLDVLVTSRSRYRHEQLIILGSTDRLEIRDGAFSADLDGERITRPARPAATLRSEVYRRMVAAIRSGEDIGVLDLARSRPTISALNGLTTGVPDQVLVSDGIE
ncbi:Gfo/Idh/MocA family protein [Nocardia wallacei]|uniref:Gfo/Idh/MocA family protein n=1 Tax=Nocardia wallacei TaxID=480035 RepID=UPI00245443D3|nr:Gfo/Idh/MocA family oxidoreductase [Nocardia wallacei]